MSSKTGVLDAASSRLRVPPPQGQTIDDMLLGDNLAHVIASCETIRDIVNTMCINKKWLAVHTCDNGALQYRTLFNHAAIDQYLREAMYRYQKAVPTDFILSPHGWLQIAGLPWWRALRIAAPFHIQISARSRERATHFPFLVCISLYQFLGGGHGHTALLNVQPAHRLVLYDLYRFVVVAFVHQEIDSVHPTQLATMGNPMLFRLACYSVRTDSMVFCGRDDGQRSINENWGCIATCPLLHDDLTSIRCLYDTVLGPCDTELRRHYLEADILPSLTTSERAFYHRLARFLEDGNCLPGSTLHSDDGQIHFTWQATLSCWKKTKFYGNSFVALAAALGRVEIVEWLIHLPLFKCHSHEYALVDAHRLHDKSGARTFLWSLLFPAIRQGRVEVVRILIDAGLAELWVAHEDADPHLDAVLPYATYIMQCNPNADKRRDSSVELLGLLRQTETILRQKWATYAEFEACAQPF